MTFAQTLGKVGKLATVTQRVAQRKRNPVGLHPSKDVAEGLVRTIARDAGDGKHTDFITREFVRFIEKPENAELHKNDFEQFLRPKAY